MILSASRRTDIPNYYSEWFLNRIREGFLYVRNPMNIHQVSEIGLSPKVVDCIVFWTKNPEPMIGKLNELKDYNYYFQFTLTGYGEDVEGKIPHKKETMVPIFQRLSKKIGKEKVIWRYAPIIFTNKYTQEYHLKAFEQIANSLNGYTNKCIISFVDTYVKNKKNMDALKIHDLDKAQLLTFLEKLSQIAFRNKMELGSCAEHIDLTKYGIKHNSCIDKELVETIIGCRINANKDKNQREECGCVESIEIGTYNTCKNGCKYCYANYSQESVVNNCNKYNPTSPLLCSDIMEGDKINKRKVKSIKDIGKFKLNLTKQQLLEMIGSDFKERFRENESVIEIENAKFWIASDGKVDQIGVEKDFKGKYEDVIGLGSILSDVKQKIGSYIQVCDTYELEEKKGIPAPIS